jgi:L-ribulose-5-phosphate 3-epimerase
MDGTSRRAFLKASVGSAVAWRVAAARAFAEAPPGLSSRIAVCSWSLEPTSLGDLLAKLAQTGVRRMQIALDPLRENEGGAWSDAGRRCADEGVTLVSGMFGTIGEDYTTLESIRRTGGVVPDATWADNWRNIEANAALAEKLGLKLVTFHAGFLPHEAADPSFAKLQSRVRQIADLFAAKGIAIGMETGQETAHTLTAFLQKLDRGNVGVNFDPANIVLYDKGEPLAAAKVLAPWIRQCHVKDAVRTRTPGTWGEEVPVGKGEVGWKTLLPALSAAGFTGPLCIEREAGHARVADIRAARALLETLQ